MAEKELSYIDDYVLSGLKAKGLPQKANTTESEIRSYNDGLKLYHDIISYDNLSTELDVSLGLFGYGGEEVSKSMMAFGFDTSTSYAGSSLMMNVDRVYNKLKLLKSDIVLKSKGIIDEGLDRSSNYLNNVISGIENKQKSYHDFFIKLRDTGVEMGMGKRC